MRSAAVHARRTRRALATRRNSSSLGRAALLPVLDPDGVQVIDAPVAREQWLRVVVGYAHPLAACVELADYLDSIAASTGDRYFAGLADALRVARPHVTARNAVHWIN
jgi:hypothetical protein